MPAKIFRKYLKLKLNKFRCFFEKSSYILRITKTTKRLTYFFIILKTGVQTGFTYFINIKCDLLTEELKPSRDITGTRQKVIHFLVKLLHSFVIATAK